MQEKTKKVDKLLMYASTDPHTAGVRLSFLPSWASCDPRLLVYPSTLKIVYDNTFNSEKKKRKIRKMMKND